MADSNDGGFIFDRDAAKRIVRAVKATEGNDLSGGRVVGAQNPNQCITAKLLSQSGDKYAWQQVRRLTTGWEVVTDGLSGTTTDRPAWQLDPTDTADLSNKYVTLVRVGGKSSDGKPIPIWVIVGTASLPTGQYAEMHYKMISNNASGWGFAQLHGPLT